MTNPRRNEPHPALPVPARHRDFLRCTAWTALDVLGADPQASFDIRGAALIVRELLQHYTVEGAGKAVSEALAALDLLAAGSVSPDAAKASCGPLVEVFDALLRGVTWARLNEAQTIADTALMCRATS